MHINECRMCNGFSVLQIKKFLTRVDTLFPIHISEKTDLEQLSEKYIQKALLIGFCDSNDEVIALIAGYINDEETKIGYISLLAVEPEFQNKGFARLLIAAFIEAAKGKKIKRVFLFTHNSNKKAIGFYRKNGFIEEPQDIRPEDIKFIKDL